MQARGAADEGGGDKITFSNRRFGALLQAIDELPKAVIVLIEGAAMGGAVGLIAVADWVIAEKGAQIGTPEVTVGIVPAQITPFIVQRIGAAHARRLTAFGMRLGAEEASRIGLVHEVAEGHDALLDKGAAAVNQVLRCAPGAVAETKRLLRLSLGRTDALAPLLDEAAGMFAASLAGEAKEGISAFLEKRKPAWVAKVEKL
jgi:isohexenylglutaconyl-CoA hydratase